MSIIVVAWVRDNFKGPKVEKIVLLTLASRVGEKDYCFTFMEKLAKDVEYSVRHVRRAIASLREKGVLEVVDRRHRHLPNKFIIRPDMLRPDTGDRSDRTQETARPDMGDRSILNKHKETIKRTPAVRTAEVIDMNTEETMKGLGEADDPLDDSAMVGKLNSMSQTVGNATRVWRRMMKTHHDAYTPEFTRKEMGQFKLFIERAPAGQQLAIMGVAIKNWNLLSLPKGASRLPKIGNLLTRIEEADQLLHEVINRADQSKPQPRQKNRFQKGIF